MYTSPDLSSSRMSIFDAPSISAIRPKCPNTSFAPSCSKEPPYSTAWWTLSTDEHERFAASPAWSPQRSWLAWTTLPFTPWSRKVCIPSVTPYPTVKIAENAEMPIVVAALVVGPDSVFSHFLYVSVAVTFSAPQVIPRDATVAMPPRKSIVNSSKRSVPSSAIPRPLRTVGFNSASFLAGPAQAENLMVPDTILPETHVEPSRMPFATRCDPASIRSDTADWFPSPASPEPPSDAAASGLA
mmetsp:Transcript_27277/g.62251  ORF Transcript_27277/g.62251 Transcript_27277/m.62251 type:complete len:242 (-) Transcript_27277:234-959(-)